MVFWIVTANLFGLVALAALLRLKKKNPHIRW